MKAVADPGDTVTYQGRKIITCRPIIHLLTFGYTALHKDPVISSRSYVRYMRSICKYLCRASNSKKPSLLFFSLNFVAQELLLYISQETEVSPILLSKESRTIQKYS